MLAKVLSLVSRVMIGLMFAETGWGKIHNIEKVREYFVSLHIPLAYYQAPFVAFVELVGGVLLIVGLSTRWAAIPLMGTMAVAILTAKWDEIDSITTLATTSEFLLLLLLAWIAVEGPGLFSIDGWRKKTK